MKVAKFFIITTLGIISFFYIVKLIDGITLFLPHDFEKLKKHGDEIRIKLDRYHDKNNIYPESLEQLGINNPISWYGRWQYNSLGGNLSIGDYNRDGFILFWNNTTKEWVLNI